MQFGNLLGRSELTVTHFMSSELTSSGGFGMNTAEIVGALSGDSGGGSPPLTTAERQFLAISASLLVLNEAPGAHGRSTGVSLSENTVRKKHN